MNRGSLAEDPKGGLSSSSRYSRMGGERNSLLYADSISVRRAAGSARKVSRAAGEPAEVSHYSKEKKSVGRTLTDSHMDRLEVGSDGRLFYVRENHSKSFSSGPSLSHTVSSPHERRETDQNPLLRENGSNSLLRKAGPNPLLRKTDPNPLLRKTDPNPLLKENKTGSYMRSRSLKDALPLNGRQAVSDTLNPSAGEAAGMAGSYLTSAGKEAAAGPYSATAGKAAAAGPNSATAAAAGSYSATAGKAAAAGPYSASENRNPLLNSRKRHAFRKYIAAAVIAAAAAAYCFTAYYFTDRFYPGTSFFGIDVTGMPADSARTALQSKVDTYELKLETRNPDEDAEDGNVITAGDAGLTYVDDGTTDKVMAGQKSWAWPVMMIAGRLTKHSRQIKTSYNSSMAKAAMLRLPCFQEDNIIEPQDAGIELTDDGAVVDTEIYGTRLDENKTWLAVKNALDKGISSINLDQLGLYVNPKVYSADVSLMEEAQALNKVLGAKITLTIGNAEEVIDSEVISSFLTMTDGSYQVDSGKVSDYVEKLAVKYDTYQKARTFYTSIGTTVQLEEGAGDYGWQIDQEATADMIISAVQDKRKLETQPVFSVEAFSQGSDDIGDTYVEINLTTQTMWFYKGGALVVKTPVVTGNPYAGNATPSGGVWSLKNRLRNQLLSGEGYTSPVDYWLPFNGGIGIHDMQTRAWFGGSIYLGSGSHGCINTPLAAVKLIYNSIEVGTPVIVYEDDSDTASSLITGPYDTVSLTAEIEETYGTAEDDGAGSIVYWTKQQKAAAVQNTTAASGSAGAGSQTSSVQAW